MASEPGAEVMRGKSRDLVKSRVDTKDEVVGNMLAASRINSPGDDRQSSGITSECGRSRAG